MITLAGPGAWLQDLRGRMWHAELESAAILLCVPVRLGAEAWRLIVRETHVAPDAAYEERSPVTARLRPSFGLPFEKRARQNGWSLVYCHTHPTQRGTPRFSAIDDAAEVPLAAFAVERSPGVPHLALLLGFDGVASRRLGPGDPARVVEVGASVEVRFDPALPEPPAEIFDRQLRAFGAQGQQRLAATRVAIIGLGGTGSLVAQQLAYLGVKDFVLVDRDRLEATNLNRTVGALATDLGTAKVAVAERMIKAVRRDARVVAQVEDVVDEGAARQLVGCDFLFACTDSHASRHVLNQLAYQYLLPAIDVGVAIDAAEAQEVRFAGHVKALAPGLACLWCVGHLDPARVREEMMSPEQRAVDPYFAVGRGIAQPAVISINGAVASLAVTMFLSMVAGVPNPPRYLVYDGNRARTNAVAAQPDPQCNFCSSQSTALGGDAFPLPERRREQS